MPIIYPRVRHSEWSTRGSCLHDVVPGASLSQLLQGYLAQKKAPPPQDPTVGICVGPYGGPKGGAFVYERVTPVSRQRQSYYSSHSSRRAAKVPNEPPAALIHVPGFRVQGLGFRVRGLGFRVQGSGFRVQGSGCRVQGSGFRVQG